MRINHTFEVKDERELSTLKRACLDCRISFTNKGGGRVLVLCEPSEIERLKERWRQLLAEV